MLETASLGEPARLVTVKWLAECLRQQGQLAEAQRLLERTLSAHEEKNNARAAVALKLVLAKVLLAQGDLPAAHTLAAQCEELIAANGIERHRPDVIFLAGSLAEARGEPAQARAGYTEAMTRFQQIGLRREYREAEAALQRLSVADEALS